MRERACYRRIFLTCFVTGLVAISACGCAWIDKFGGRATAYNFETSDAKSSTILLNIVRAAYTEPLQFTDVTTVSGQATASATLSGNIPWPFNHPAVIAPRSATVSPSATAG